MGEAALSKASLAILQLQFHRRLSQDIVLHRGRAQRHENIIAVMLMQQGAGMGRDFHFEDAHVFVLQRPMMRRLAVERDGLLGASASYKLQATSCKESDSCCASEPHCTFAPGCTSSLARTA